MNILLVIDSLGSGGAQRQLVTLACGLKLRGHCVAIFIYYPEYHYLSELEECGIPVFCIKKRGRFSLMPIFHLMQIMLKSQYDVVVSYLDTPNLYCEIACLFVPRTRLVVSERFMYTPGRLSAKLLLKQQLHRFTHYITVNSHHQRKRMVKEFAWMENKIITIYNGYDMNIFKPIITQTGSDPFLKLLAISSVSSKKNSINLAKAIKTCRDKYNITVLVDWVGAISVSGEGTRSFITTNKYLSEHKLDSQWTWLGIRHDIVRLLNAHDALIHTSYYEGLPNVICEGLACGRPILASDVCDHAVLLSNGITGFLFDPASPDDIADAISRFYHLNEDERKRMGMLARTYAEENLSVDRYVDKYENLFNSLIH